MLKNIIRIILEILLIGTFFIIFGFSNQNGEESSGVSRKVTEFIAEKIINVPDNEKQETIENMEGIVRKLAHFSIYTMVGLLLMGIVSTYSVEEMKQIYMIYATTDEIHQSFIPDRSAQLTDVMIDTMGVILGILIVMLVIKVLIKKEHKICQK